MKNKRLHTGAHAGLIFMIALFLSAAPATAQKDGAATKLPDRIISPMIAVDPVTLHGKGMRIHLWGIKPAQTSEAPLELRALDLMDAIIGDEDVNCKIMGGTVTEPYARCTTRTQQDVGLELLTQGFAIVDRSQTYNTVFASSYATAQETARLNGNGVWKLIKNADADQDEGLFGNGLLLLTSFFGPLVGLVIVGLFMYHGLSRLYSQQEKETEENRRKEAGLQSREKQVLTSTLEGEMMENKNKVEAFLAIYNDMLRGLQNKDEAPKYQQVGDTIQKYPTFSRFVFETSVGKLSLLDIKTASMISKFYAAHPSEQEYINLDPEVPLETAIKLVKKVVDEAQSITPEIDNILTALHNATPTQNG